MSKDEIKKNPYQIALDERAAAFKLSQQALPHNQRAVVGIQLKAGEFETTFKNVSSPLQPKTPTTETIMSDLPTVPQLRAAKALQQIKDSRQ